MDLFVTVFVISKLSAPPESLDDSSNELKYAMHSPFDTDQMVFSKKFTPL